MLIFKMKCYRINKIGLILCGVWPQQSPTVAYIIRAIVVLSLVSLIIPEQVYLYNVGLHYTNIIPSLPSLAAIAIVFAKFYFFVGQKNIVFKVTNQMQNDWQLFNNNPAIKKLMQQFATQGYYFILFYMYYVSSAATVFAGVTFFAPIMDIIIPLNETREKIPSFPTNYGIDGDKYFILIGIHGFIVASIAMTWLWTTDAFIIMMVYHCSSLFNIVGILLQQLSMKNCNYDEQCEKKIITQAIIVHKYAISFAEFIEKSVTKVYGFVFIINMIMMSITGFYAVLNFEKRKPEAIRMALFTVSQGVHLFLNTIPSQCIINSSESVFRAVYNCKWDELSIKSKNLLSIMLTRSSKPYTLTAGKFYPVNFENFGNIIKTSMSYLTVLNSMQ